MKMTPKTETLSEWEVVCILEALTKFEGAHKQHKAKLIEKLEKAKQIMLRG